jgi:FAD/FMN-containing dehydrogenase
MNRRSFLWQGLCSSVPFFTKPSFSQQLATLPISKPSNAELTAFVRSLTGAAYHSGDPSYERLRKGYAAKFDQHPALVVHPVNSKDIQSTLRFATTNHLPLAIRCGGHSYAAWSSCDGGIVLDMSGFCTVDISADRSHANIGGGMLCGAVEIETSKAGVATVLGQCPSVGVGGFLLGGGVGPLMSKFGLGCDNVLAADMILADGREVKASANENQHLYWAIRGFHCAASADPLSHE